MQGGLYTSDVILRILPPIIHFCGIMGSTCGVDKDCCTNNICNYPNGYDDTTTRYCGLRGATGCKMTETAPGIGCCFRNYCD